MIGRLAALILLSILSQTMTIPQKIPLIVAELGDDVNLTCSISGDDTMLFYWYKLEFRSMLQTVAAGSIYKLSLQGQFDNSRFNITRVNSLYSLNIKNVSKEDEATYFCQTGAAYVMRFTKGIVLAVKGNNGQQKSIYVEQTPETASVQPGSSTTLQCSLLSKDKENTDQCPDEHTVYWFRAGSGESRPSVIYAHNHSSDEDEGRGRSCVYSLSKTIRNSSDTGTYYCAVVTCGEILFGEGTKVETSQELLPFVILLVTLLACCVIVNVALIISRNRKAVCEHCRGAVTASNHAEHDRSAEDRSNEMDGGAVAVNYVALDFPSRKRERWMSNREIPQDCMYSGMRDYQ